MRPTRYFRLAMSSCSSRQTSVHDPSGKAHETLPLKKIQLRYIRRDGFPHSPFRDHDCVSVDTFLLRRHREKNSKRT